MKTIWRLVKATPERKTRFHTERGERLSARGWCRLPRLIIVRALRRGGDDSPWMVPRAVDRLDELIEPNWTVLELGAGASTQWYERRAGRVLSLESDPGWCAHVRARLARLGATRAEVRHVPLSHLYAVVAEQPDRSFDLVVVDPSEQEDVTRVGCVERARAKVKPGGVLVLDDSDRPEYARAFELLREWSVERLVGVKPVPLVAVETSIFRRPSQPAS